MWYSYNIPNCANLLIQDSPSWWFFNGRQLLLKTNASIDLLKCFYEIDLDNIEGPWLPLRTIYFLLFQCEPLSGLGFRRGSYKCVCQKGEHWAVRSEHGCIFYTKIKKSTRQVFQNQKVSLLVVWGINILGKHIGYIFPSRGIRIYSHGEQWGRIIGLFHSLTSDSILACRFLLPRRLGNWEILQWVYPGGRVWKEVDGKNKSLNIHLLTKKTVDKIVTNTKGIHLDD